MTSFKMKKLRIITSISSIILGLFTIFQITKISKHKKEVYNELNIANPHLFSDKFDLLLVSRTLKHEKGIDYWFDWINYQSGLITINKTISLLHFDLHSIEDNSDQSYHICSAPNLLMYDFFVQQTLDMMYDCYFGDLEPNPRANITRSALRKGYVRDIVWIFPNHWINDSQEIVMNTSMKKFKEMIYHQTFFINPEKEKFYYLDNEIIRDNQIWNKLFGQRQLFENVTDKMNSSENLLVNIWVLSLNQYINEPYFKHMDINNIIFDVDLDFFVCQKPAETFMHHYDWNKDKINQFNHLLQHHQYTPSHMFSEYSNQAITTLIHLLNENEIDALKFQSPQQKSKEHMDQFKTPQIEDVFKIALEEKMDIETIKRVIYLLYEYQLERSHYQSDAIQHLMHFDHIFEILNSAHRRLIDLEIIGYQDSEQALHLTKTHQSAHMKRLKEIAIKQRKEERFRNELMEINKIREMNYDDAHTEFEDFAQKLIDLQHDRRILVSAEIDDLGQQEIKQMKSEDRMYHTDWHDHELKDLMNVTLFYDLCFTLYLYLHSYTFTYTDDN